MSVLPARSEALVIAARFPQSGAVKTRLARTLGDDAACQLYIGFLRDLKETVGSQDRPVVWAYAPAESDFELFIGSGNHCLRQRGEGLGARMSNIFTDIFDLGYERVVLIGSDLPHLPVEWVNEAFASMNWADAVFSPADDGGYNLVGLKAPHDLFTGIAMSTPSVLDKTLERATALGLTVHLLPALFDVDEIEDLEKLRIWLSSHPDRLPHTRDVLFRLERLTRGPATNSLT